MKNKNERFFATEYIREQAFELLQDEIPYEVAVVIDEYNHQRILRDWERKFNDSKEYD